MPPTALPPPRPAVTRIKESLPRAEWDTAFASYFAAARGYDLRHLDDAHAVLTTLDLGAEEADRCLAAAATELRAAGTDAKGTLGEAHFSYVLERRRRILLTDAGWKSAPFQVSKGIDLVGVLLPELIVCHIEVKSWDASTDGKVRAAFRAMTHDKKETIHRKGGSFTRIEPAQLGLARLKPLYERSSSTGHRATVAMRLMEILDGVNRPDWADKLVLDDDRIEDELPDLLLRIGGVVTEFTGSFPDNVEGPVDATPDDPCELILVSVEGLKERLVRLTALERQLQESKAVELKARRRARAKTRA